MIGQSDGSSHHAIELYRYSPLDESKHEIRLFRLQPGDFNDDLHLELFPAPLISSERRSLDRLSLVEMQKTLPKCCMVHDTLQGRYVFVCQDAVHGTSWEHPDPQFDHSKYNGEINGPDPNFEPKYEALSYCWGSSESHECALVLDGSESQADKSLRKITINRNLALALRYLRRQDESRVLWVDAICIDQSNIAEKCIQVRNMSNVYSLAQSVLISLDSTLEDSALAIQILRRIGLQCVITNETTNGMQIHAAPGSRELGMAFGEPDHPITLKEWMSVATFSTQDWFHRLWVYQEAKLANTSAKMVCGFDSIDHTVWRPAMLVLHFKLHQPPEFPHRLVFKSTFMFVDEVGRYPFTWLLDWGSNFICTDPRDHIYGILGLASKAMRSAITIDYTQTLEESFVSIALAMMKHHRRVEILSFCILNEYSLDMPSWARNWTSKKGMAEFISPQFCSGFSRADFEFEAPGILHVSGVLSQTIRRVSRPIEGDTGKIIEFVTEHQPFRGGEKDESRMDAYLNCLRQEQFNERLLESPLSRSAWRGVFDRIIAGNHMEADQFFINGLVLDLQYRVLFETEDGQFGLGPIGAQKGDVVCVFLGSDSPIVLRQKQENKFQIIGQCYSNGLSDVTAFLGPLPKPWVVIRDSFFGILDWRFRFKNTSTGQVTVHDPRLDNLRAEWEWVDSERTNDDPEVFERFHNSGTGETVNFDPRMSSEALRARVVKLRTFSLV